MRAVGTFLAGCVLMVAAGCTKADKIAVYAVSGRIMYDGKPAVGVQVFLLPTSAPTVPDIPANPHGVTGTDGRFTLSTYGQNDGAAEGGYQVVLFWPPEPKEGEEGSKEDRLLGWYTGAHSRISVNVPAGGVDFPVWELPVMRYPPAAGGVGVPGRN